MKCIGCYREVPDNIAVAINDNGDMACPVCTFIIAVYTENKINKKFQEGELMYHKISNNIRKAVDLFLKDRKLAYETYLPQMLKRMRGIEVSNEAMDKLLDETFPFLKLTVDQCAQYNVSVGDEVRVTSPDGRTLKRNVYAARHFTGKESREHHYGRKAFTAYFIPATI